MIYQIAEKFKSIQGEGLYAGTPMAFIRFVGCSVGKKTCHACDTDFEKMHNWRGGGTFDEEKLSNWTAPYGHICLTGGEPLDQDLAPLLLALCRRVTDSKFSALHSEFYNNPSMVHIETSGTLPIPSTFYDAQDKDHLWICVSPKPGYREDVVLNADEIKVIVPGLGSGSDWPKIGDALRWADVGKLVYLQPRNAKFDVDQNNLRIVQDIIAQYPQLRLSVQMHKILKVQ